MCSYSYRLYGMKVIADLEFPQLCTIEDNAVAPTRDETEKQVVIRKMTAAEQKPLQAEYGEGICTSRIGTEESILSNRTLQMKVLRGKEIRYRCLDGADIRHLRTYLLGFGMAMLSLQRGMLPFHCSALQMPEGGAVLIAGESGAGKSTLTAGLLGQGYRFLADDMAVVDPASAADGTVSPVVYPAFPYLKLCRDAVLRRGLSPERLWKAEETKTKKEKFLVPYTGEFRTEGVPVKSFLLLGKRSEDRAESAAGEADGEQKKVRVEKVTGLASMLVYKENLFLRHLWRKRRPEAAVEEEAWQKCLNLAEKVPVYYVERAAAGDSTAEVAAEVHELLRS